MKNSSDRLLGQWGEALCARYLYEQGYTVLEHHCCYREGELDLLAERGEILAVVEVKLRTGTFQTGAEAVTARKQGRIKAAMGRYLSDHPELAERYIRFDVCQITAPDGTDTDAPELIYFEQAFD